MSFTPRLSILPTPQRLLWDELGELPPAFVLYGGTAIALHLGHRESLDFDFFTFQPFDTLALYNKVPFLAGSQILQQAPNTLTCLLDRSGLVKLSFFGVPRLAAIEPPYVAENGLHIATLLDLAGMKAAVVQQRAEAKDYLDIDAMMEHGIGLPTALAAACLIYGEQFNPQITLKALSYFGEGDLERLPQAVKQRIIKAVASVDLSALPRLEKREPLP